MLFERDLELGVGVSRGEGLRGLLHLSESQVAVDLVRNDLVLLSILVEGD